MVTVVSTIVEVIALLSDNFMSLIMANKYKIYVRKFQTKHVSKEVEWVPQVGRWSFFGEGRGVQANYLKFCKISLS